MSLDSARTVIPHRILHIMRAPVGGLFRHVSDLAQEQARMGHEVGIVCDITCGTAVEEKLKHLGTVCTLGVHRVPMSRTIGIADFSAYAAIKRLVDRLEPDVLHGHGAKGGAYARLMPRERGRIALYTPHGGSLHYLWRNPAGALYLALERFLRRRTDGLLFDSEFSAACYRRKMGWISCQARIVPNGLGEDDFVSLKDAKPTYDAVFVGELRALKGIATLIEATRLFAQQRPFRLAIAGEGADEARFRAEVAAKGLDKNVDFLGHKSARDVFAQGRIVVVPSLAESSPYIVLEAIAAERPLVATNVGGIPEIFGSCAGTLVPPGNATALYEGMRLMLDRPIAAQALASMLKKRAERLFVTARMARDITQFYAELRRFKPGRPGTPDPQPDQIAA